MTIFATGATLLLELPMLSALLDCAEAILLVDEVTAMELVTELTLALPVAGALSPPLHPGNDTGKIPKSTAFTYSFTVFHYGEIKFYDGLMTIVSGGLYFPNSGFISLWLRDQTKTAIKNGSNRAA